jgi:hypothetical protein
VKVLPLRASARVGLAVLLALGLAGCVVSEQSGQLVPDGNPRYWDQKLGEVSFHFDSPFNKAVVYGRSLLLALLGFWVFRAEQGGRRVLTLTLGVPLLVLAGFLLYRDLPTLLRYRIEAREDGLTIEIPPDVAHEVGWDGIEGMTVTGSELRRENPGPAGSNPFVDLPEWHAMDLTFAGGETVHVDLRRLSWEQRQSVWKAIAVRARLVERR